MGRFSDVLLIAWLGVIVGGPAVGLVLGPWLRRTLSTRFLVIGSAAAALIVAMALMRLSLPGILVDHLLLGAAYVWVWMCLGMVRSRALRTAIFGVPTLVVLWAIFHPGAFFLHIIAADLTRLPERTVSMDCGWSTRVVRMRRYGWAAESGYELSVYSRPWGVPLELQRESRSFDDAQFSAGNLFSARVVDGSHCTTVVAYDGHDEWTAK